MMEFEQILCGAAAGLALLLGIGIWRAQPQTSFGLAGLACCLGGIGYLFWGLPATLSWPAPARFVLAALALWPAFFIWIFARTLFDDGFRLRPIHWVALAVIECVGLTIFLCYDALSANSAGQQVLLVLSLVGVHLPSAALVAHALWIVASGRHGDLVELRRQLRLIVLAGAGAIALIIVAALLFAPAPHSSVWFRLAEESSILLVAMGGAILLFRFDSSLLPTDGSATLTFSVGSEALPAYADDPAYQRLQGLMMNEEIWRETGLTIGTLAKRVGLPEYRLRRLINDRLGFRNFTAFLNAYRLPAAAEHLADLSQARTPVLTIALTLGWGSIGPFNRAFREQFGMTPTDFRRQNMTERH